MRFAHRRMKPRPKNIPFRFTIRYSHVPGRIRCLEVWMNTHHWAVWLDEL
jgi:hypothetical protein